METSEWLDDIWSRVEPCIKQLVPQMTQIDLFRTRALVKRVLSASLKAVDLSNLDYAERYLLAGKLDIKANKQGEPRNPLTLLAVEQNWRIIAFLENVGKVKKMVLTQHSFGGTIFPSESRLVLGAMRQSL